MSVSPDSTTNYIDYEDQIYYMMSYAGIRSQILHTDDDTGSNIYPLIKRNTKAKTVKRTVNTLDEFKSNPDVICAIQSEHSLLNILTSYRKQKIPVVYLYVDNSGYLTVIIKVISYYPVVIIRLPVNDQNIYVNPDTTEAYYSFPINHISFKSVGKTSQYQLVLYNTDSLKLDINTFSSDNKKRNTTISNVNIVPKEIVSSILATESIKSIGLNTRTPVDPVTSLNGSTVMMIHTVADATSIFEFASNKSTIDDESNIVIGYDEITPDVCKIVYTFCNSHMNEIIPICTEQDSILWSFHIQPGTSKKYFIETHDNLFKLNYSKYLYGKNKMYYVVVSYMDVLLFIRLIWSGDIKAKRASTNDYRGTTFGSLFDKNMQIMDMHMLRELNE